MASPEIHIDSIQLNVRGISPAVANAAFSSLGASLHAALTLQLSGLSVSASSSIEQLTAPALRVPSAVSASTLRAAVVSQLASTIANQVSAPSPQTPQAS